MNRSKCPYCGKETYSFFDRMMAGGMASKGRVCRECGRRSVHGLDSTLFNTIVWLVVLICLYNGYKKGTPSQTVCLIVFAAGFVISRLANGFFGLAMNNRRE